MFEQVRQLQTLCEPSGLLFLDGPQLAAPVFYLADANGAVGSHVA